MSWGGAGPPRGGMRIPRFLQGAREGCLKSSRPARYPSGRCSVCQLPALFSSRGSSLHRWGTVARKESCIFCGRTAFTPCRRAHSQPSIRAGGEKGTPVHGRTGVSSLHTLHPSPLYAFLQHACVSPRRRSKASTVLRAANPCNAGLEAVAPAPRSRSHSAHPDTRHPRPADPGTRTPPPPPRAPARTTPATKKHGMPMPDQHGIGLLQGDALDLLHEGWGGRATVRHLRVCLCVCVCARARAHVHMCTC
jgi:hypothetical protein